MRTLEEVPITGPGDRLCLGLARVHHSFLGRRGRLDCDDPQVDEAADLASHPALKSSWLYTQAAARTFQARYVEAEVLARSALAELGAFGLSFGLPHAEWALAAAELGLRRFARCEARLRKIEQLPGHVADPHMQLNMRALRARLLLSQGRVGEAAEVTSPRRPSGARRSMNGEYLATSALALAVLGQRKQAVFAAREAVELTSWIDTRILAEAANTISALDGGSNQSSTVEQLLELASTIGVWDGVVCAFRASPEFRTALGHVSDHRAELADVLIRSNDVALAKSCGLVNRVTGTGGKLSRRERKSWMRSTEAEERANRREPFHLAWHCQESHGSYFREARRQNAR